MLKVHANTAKYALPFDLSLLDGRFDIFYSRFYRFNPEPQNVVSHVSRQLHTYIHVYFLVCEEQQCQRETVYSRAQGVRRSCCGVSAEIEGEFMISSHGWQPSSVLQDPTLCLKIKCGVGSEPRTPLPARFRLFISC